MAYRILILPLLAASAPLYAADGVQIPEPSNMALMALGLTGLIVGRYAAKSKNKRDDS